MNSKSLIVILVIISFVFIIMINNESGSPTGNVVNLDSSELESCCTYINDYNVNKTCFSVNQDCSYCDNYCIKKD